MPLSRRFPSSHRGGPSPGALYARCKYLTTLTITFILRLPLQEVNRNKEEWDIVMDRVERIAGLVNKVGTLCEEHDLEEKDVPRGLRVIFEPLVTYAIHS